MPKSGLYSIFLSLVDVKSRIKIIICRNIKFSIIVSIGLIVVLAFFYGCQNRDIRTATDSKDRGMRVLERNPIGYINVASEKIDESNDGSLIDHDLREEVSLAEFPLKGLVKEVLSGNQVEVMIDSGERSIRVQYLGVRINADDESQMDSSLGLNKFLCLDKIVTISGEDTYFDVVTGSFYAYVYVQGEFINEILISNGFAFVDDSIQTISKMDQLIESQNDAMIRGLGMWEGFINGGKNICGTLPCAN